MWQRKGVLQYLQQQFHQLRVDQTLNRLSIHVGDEVASAEACLIGLAALLHTLQAHSNPIGLKHHGRSALHSQVATHYSFECGLMARMLKS